MVKSGYTIALRFTFLHAETCICCIYSHLQHPLCNSGGGGPPAGAQEDCSGRAEHDFAQQDPKGEISSQSKHLAAASALQNAQEGCRTESAAEHISNTVPSSHQEKSGSHSPRPKCLTIGAC